MDHSVGKARWLLPRVVGQQLNVQVELLRSWYWDWSCLPPLLVTWVSGIKRTFSKFAYNSKPCGAVHTLEGKDGIQTDLHRLERWAHANIMKFNKTKCEVLHLGQSNPQHKYKLGRERIEGSPEAAKILLAPSKLRKRQ